MTDQIESPPRIMMDSGAFSAWKLNRPVNLEAYCDFLLENADWIDVPVALDEIIPNDPELAAKRSFDNLVYMRSRGLDPVPVWHVRESIDWIKRILDLGCQYVGLSATSIVSHAATDDWYEMAWSYLVDSAGAPLVRVHAFGESRQTILVRYPWASADSSTWLDAERYGTLRVPRTDTRFGDGSKYTNNATMPNLALLAGEDRREFDSLLDLMGISFEVFQSSRSQTSRMARLLIHAYRYHLIQTCVRERLPIRFCPGYEGFLTGPEIPEKRIWEFPDEFNFFLAVGGSYMPTAAAYHLGHRNVLVSYFYVATRAALLRALRRDPDALKSSIYGKYLHMARDVGSRCYNLVGEPVHAVL